MSFIKWAIVLAIGIFIGMSFASAALADDIVSYYKLDEASGNAIDADGGTHNLTETGTIDTQTGIISGARGVFGNSDYFSKTGVLSVDENTDFTINLWVKKIGSAVNHNTLAELGDSGTYGDFGAGIQIRNNQKARIYIDKYSAATTLSVESTSVIPLNVWTMVTFTYNGSTELGKLYIDGSFDVSDTNTATGFNVADGFAIGNRFMANPGADVSYIDETGLWNRTLGDTEVSDLYNSGIGRSYPFDGTASLNSPANEYVSPTTSVEFNSTSYATEDETLVNMTLYHNASGTWTAIETQSITGIENTTTWTDTFSDGDDFIWGVQACDTLECFFSGNRSLSIDTTNPIIDIITPANGTLFDLFKEVGNTQDINFTITDTNLDTCWYEYNGVNTTFGTGGNCEIIEVGQDLIAYYKLDETTGVVVDELGNYDGTNYGSTRGVAGIINDAFDFSNDYVEIDDVITNYSTSTINLWMKTTTSTRGGLIGNDKSGKNDDYIIELDSGTGDCDVGEIFLQRADSDTASDYSVCSDGVVNDGNWHMVTAIANSSGMFLYIDGVIQTDWDSFSEASTNQGGWVLGSNGLHLLNRNYTGTLDEVGIWESSLTEEEIIELYNSGMGQRPINTFTLENVGTLPWHELTIWANDTAGNVGSNYTIWEYRGFITNQTFESPVLETATSNYTLDLILGTNTSFSVGSLFVNGTEQSTGSFTTVGNNVSLTSLITVPSVTTGSVSELFDVYWNLTLADTISGTTYNNLSSTQQQNVTELIFNFCGNGGATTPVLNFTMVDEITNVEINATANATTFEATFLLGASADSLTKTFSFSNQSVNISQFDFCVNSEDDVIYTDMQSEYSAIGYTDKNYYLVGATLNGTATNEIDLFLLQDDEAVEFFITLTQSLAPVADAYIHVAKYSVGEGIYKTVEIDITDTSGKIGAWLDLEKQYRFTVIKDDEILGIFERSSLCEAAPCEINLNLESDTTDWMSIYTDTFAQNVLYNITFNPVTKIVDFSFVDTTGLATSFRMDIVKLDDYINGSEILNTQRVFTSSGSMTYNASLLDDGDYRVMTYIARSPDTFIEFIDFLINTFGTSFGMLGLIFSFLFILVVIFGMAVSPTLLILSIPFGMHMARLTGFFNLDVAVIVCFYVLGGLAIYAMNK